MNFFKSLFSDSTNDNQDNTNKSQNNQSKQANAKSHSTKQTVKTKTKKYEPIIEWTDNDEDNEILDIIFLDQMSK